MKVEPFELEQFLGRQESSAHHVLCASDPEPVRMQELLDQAEPALLRAWQNLELGYTESNGHPLLRQAIAGIYRDVTPDDVLVTAGAGEALTLTFTALLDPGDDVIVVTPAYQSLVSVPRMLGARVSEIHLRREDSWTLDIGQVRDALTSRTRAIVVNFPHNPTGAVIGGDTLTSLVGIANEAGIRLISDEVYRDLEYHDADVAPAAADLHPSAVSINVLTKTLGLAGLRIGWVTTKDRGLMSRISALKDYTSICNSAPSEILGVIALGLRHRLLARSRDLIQRNMGLMTRFLAENDEVLDWVPPRAGTMAFPWFRDHRTDVDSLVTRLVEDRGVLLLPGSVYGRPDHLRFGLGRVGFEVGLEQLEQTGGLLN